MLQKSRNSKYILEFLMNASDILISKLVEWPHVLVGKVVAFTELYSIF